MTNKEFGEMPAFSNVETYNPNSGNCNGTFTNGLTKREYFAAMALQGVLASRDLQIVLNLDRDNWIEYAVKKADALINELNKESQ